MANVSTDEEFITSAQRAARTLRAAAASAALAGWDPEQCDEIYVNGLTDVLTGTPQFVSDQRARMAALGAQPDSADPKLTAPPADPPAGFDVAALLAKAGLKHHDGA